jgi:hypothetical protein
MCSLQVGSNWRKNAGKKHKCKDHLTDHLVDTFIMHSPCSPVEIKICSDGELSHLINSSGTVYWGGCGSSWMIWMQKGVQQVDEKIIVTANARNDNIQQQAYSCSGTSGWFGRCGTSGWSGRNGRQHCVKLDGLAVGLLV